MCHCFLLYSAKSSAKTRSFKHCLRIEYNPKAVAPADAKLIRYSRTAVVLRMERYCRPDYRSSRRSVCDCEGRSSTELAGLDGRGGHPTGLLASLAPEAGRPPQFEAVRSNDAPFRRS
jgi:hypothetical protein